MKWNQNIWIRRIEVDTVNNHLYCCTRTDLCIYDFNGSLIRVEFLFLYIIHALKSKHNFM